MTAWGGPPAGPGRLDSDLARTTFQLLAIGALLVSTFFIVQPFLVVTTWAITIVVATWPLLLGTQRMLGGRRGPAVAVMTLALLLVLLVPFYLVVSTVVENAGRIAGWSESLATLTLPQPPAWVAGIPLIGARASAWWSEAAAATPEQIAANVAPFARTLALWFVAQVGSLGMLLLQCLLTVVVAAILYANGEATARGAERFAHRLAGPRGEEALHLAGRAVRAVALGVVVTAIVQSLLVGVGLAVAGVPFATILTALAFILAVAQVGPIVVLIPATVWVFAKSGAFWGTGFLVWAIFCGSLDNFLRPMLIRRGADLPLLLIFAGVIGGLVAFGIIGLFIGPVVLAVAYTLLVEWVSDAEPPDERPSPRQA